MNIPDRDLPADPALRKTAIDSLARLLGRWLPGKRLRVRVTLAKGERSDLQNRALWGCAYRALETQTGNAPEDLHAYFCGEHFSWVEYKIMGKARLRPLRTTTHNEDGDRDVLSTADFADFYDFVQRRSAENGFDVPDPDPAWLEKAA